MADASITVTVASGPASGPVTISATNGDVRTLLEAARDVFNIPVGATPLVNGETVDEGYELADGDEVSFNKPAGEKG